MSLARSTMNTKPSSSMRAMSPVWNQPSRIASAVASGRFRYPLMMMGPRTHSSPTASGDGATSSPSSSTNFASRVGTTRPHEADLMVYSFDELAVTMPQVSVRP